ncbi:hypothetical protein KU6B_48870 [Mameliella alba]|uniref:hypothetical protein n=1 Tax=Mameliella alba TaxID=561184 RepID=UPI0013E52273|nr:hypothetical protein [Mameliella alba]BBU58622.1 hypothetical protein KU6B_48870 [Mameliella alba]
MVKTVTFTVEPSEGHHDVLTIKDAFQQAIDFFDLLTDETSSHVVWKLEMASTNSPFTCRGEPIDTRTWAGAHNFVAPRVESIERNFIRVANGMDFDESMPTEKVETARKILKRSTNGIGRFTAVFGEDAEPVCITHKDAERYFKEVHEPQQSLHSFLFARTSRKEHGSLEGRIVWIGIDYDQPAILLEEHKSGKRIPCRVNAETAERLADEMRAGDAWAHRRVRVRGVLNFDTTGKPMRIVDGTLSFISTQDVEIEKLADDTFTGPYSVREYLDRLQENEFGSW